MSQVHSSLPIIIGRFIDALNSFDEAALLATLAEDAFINDAQREFWGKPAIAAFVQKELIGPKVTMTVTDFRGHHELLVIDAPNRRRVRTRPACSIPADPHLLLHHRRRADLDGAFIMRNRSTAEAVVRPKSAAQGSTTILPPTGGIPFISS